MKTSSLLTSLALYAVIVAISTSTGTYFTHMNTKSSQVNLKHFSYDYE
jgi:hypothetical protein